MSCIDWEERVALHAGGDLESGEVEQHLAECADCRRLSEGLRETLGVLREVHAEEIPAAHFTAVRAGVIAEIERGRKVWRRLAWVSGVGIAAALILGLALLPGPLPAPPPRAAIRIPSAPAIPAPAATDVTAQRAATVRERLAPAATAPSRSRLVARESFVAKASFLVKYQTADPNIVIYWIGEY
jgi:hypothetical protein